MCRAFKRATKVVVFPVPNEQRLQDELTRKKIRNPISYVSHIPGGPLISVKPPSPYSLAAAEIAPSCE